MNKSSHKWTPGFTIVELLIVVVVIAILAVISILTYSGMRSRAIESTAKSDAHMFANLMQSHYFNNGNYPKDGADIASNIRAPFTRSNYALDKGNYIYCASANGVDYILIVRAVNGKNYYYGSSNSFQQYTGTIDFPNVMCAQVGLTAAGWVWGYEPDNPSWTNPGYRPWIQ